MESHLFARTCSFHRPTFILRGQYYTSPLCDKCFFFFLAKSRKLVYVGENTTMVTLTSYFIQPCPCQFLLNCKRNSHQIQQETSQKFDRRRYYLDYSTKFQQFRSFVKYYTLLHDVSYEQSPLVGLFAHTNFSNMKDANDSAQI